MRVTIFLSFFILNCFGLTFLSPSPSQLTSAGYIYSILYPQLYPFVNQAIYGTNVTVQIAPDLFACDASLANYRGKVAWFADGPCPGQLSKPQALYWNNLQAAGAIGAITTTLGTAVEQDGTIKYNGGVSPFGAIPVVLIKYLKDWSYSHTDPANPMIGMLIFAFPPNTNLTARFDYPEMNTVTRGLIYPSSTVGLVVYTGVALALGSIIISTFKLATFIQYEGGIKMSLPQMVISLCWVSSVFLSVYLIFGPDIGSQYFTWGPATFFQMHFVPYWFAGVTIYSFYLAEVSLISKAGIVGLERFKWPCVAVCVCLYIIEIIQASCFAAFSVGLDFNKVILLLACTYVIVGNLLTILVGVVSVLLVKSLLSTGNTAMTIRFGITSFFLICLIQCNIVWLYLVLAGINGISPQWGEQTPQLCSQAALWWGAPIACIFLCMSFRLSVQKEIELSKSATSSTSSMSASSKSSSMSSASDPVIEL